MKKISYTLDELANFIAEYTHDGKLKKEVWKWYEWFVRKNRQKKKIKIIK